MRYLALALLSSLVVPSAALAQKEIPRAPGYDECPMGYMNIQGTTCVSLTYYEVRLKKDNGGYCDPPWEDIAAGYCRKMEDIDGGL